MSDTDNLMASVDLPVVALRDLILLPGSVAPIEIGRKRSVAALLAAGAGDHRLLLVPQRTPEQDDPGRRGLHTIGTLAEIVSVREGNKGRYMAVVRAIDRCRIVDWKQDDPYPRALATRIGAAEPVGDDAAEEERLAARARELIAATVTQSSKESAVELPEGAGAIADAASGLLELPRDKMIALLAEPSPLARLRTVLPDLERRTEVLRVKASIAEGLADGGQERREEVLRQRLRAIQEELGEGDESGLDELADKIAAAKMPDEVRDVARKQLRRLRQMGEQSPEHSITRTYLDWLIELPWGKLTEDNLEVANAREVLDADHDGLEKIKRRILEFIAVRKLAPDKKGPILCLVGPPGVGKTSLGRSIARALGRKYVRIALGGVRDESAIRGHRRTYIGALPGRIATALKNAGSLNPVFVLDEVDKMGADFRGDPSAALLEALDPEQNHAFVDHYLEVPLDLSKVMFVVTANQLDTIPPALLDRLEIIELPGYTAREKRQIARNHLVPRQLAEHGLTAEQIDIDDSAIDEIIEHYTREAGVRSLERELAALCRQAAVGLVGAESSWGGMRIGAADVAGILGPPHFMAEVAEQEDQVGVTTGLAWTPVGGAIQFVEARLMPGTGKVAITGQLGDVMKESAQAAFSWVRSHADALGVPAGVLTGNDIHVHVPAGAVKKDGPSGGVAIAGALTSLLTDRPVRHDIAVTGEITLRGRVLPVGGIKEKLLAAHRAGCKAAILPERNRKDVIDVPASVRDELELYFVSEAADAVALLLSPRPALQAVAETVEASAAMVPPPASPAQPRVHASA